MRGTNEALISQQGEKFEALLMQQTDQANRMEVELKSLRKASAKSEVMLEKTRNRECQVYFYMVNCVTNECAHISGEMQSC